MNRSDRSAADRAVRVGVIRIALSAIVIGTVCALLSRTLIDQSWPHAGPFSGVGPDLLALKVAVAVTLAVAGAMMLSERSRRWSGVLLLLAALTWSSTTSIDGFLGSDVFSQALRLPLRDVPELLVFWALVLLPSSSRGRWSVAAGGLLGGALVLNTIPVLFTSRSHALVVGALLPSTWWPTIGDAPKPVAAAEAVFDAVSPIAHWVIPLLLILRGVRARGTDRRTVIRLLPGVACAFFAEPIGELVITLNFRGEYSPEEYAVAVLRLVLAASFVWEAVRHLSTGTTAAASIAALGNDALPIDIRDEARRQTGDPSLQLLTPLAGEWEDVGGERAVEGRDRSPRWSIRRDDRGTSIVAFTTAREPSDRDTVEGLLTAAALTLENGRIIEELAVQAGETRRSLERLTALAEIEQSWLRDLTAGGPARRLLDAQASLAMLARGSTDANEPVVRAAARLLVASEELEQLVGGDPDVLLEGGLTAALPAGLLLHDEVELSVDVPRLPLDIERFAYYLVTEAVANAIKYAFASRIAVIVALVEGVVAISVEDDGVGGATASPRGLLAVESLLEQRGGGMQLSSPQGGGTRLDVRLVV